MILKNQSQIIRKIKNTSQSQDQDQFITEKRKQEKNIEEPSLTWLDTCLHFGFIFHRKSYSIFSL